MPDTADTLLKLTPFHIIGTTLEKAHEHTHVTSNTIELQKITTPADQQNIEVGVLYMRQIDAANYGIFVKILVAGSIQEVQLAP